MEGRQLTGTPTAFSRGQIAGYIERQAGDPSRASFAVVRQEDDAGTEATRLMLDYEFGMLNLHRIELDVFTINPRALYVYEKVGFIQEGVKRQNWYYDHQYYDSIVMSMLEDDYRALYQ